MFGLRQFIKYRIGRVNLAIILAFGFLSLFLYLNQLQATQIAELTSQVSQPKHRHSNDELVLRIQLEEQLRTKEQELKDLREALRLFANLSALVTNKNQGRNEEREISVLSDRIETLLKPEDNKVMDQVRKERKMSSERENLDFYKAQLKKYCTVKDSVKKNESLLFPHIRKHFKPFQQGSIQISQLEELRKKASMLFKIVDSTIFSEVISTSLINAKAMEKMIQKAIDDVGGKIPDMEFYVNDAPRVLYQEDTPLPLFSFSTSVQFRDIPFPSHLFFQPSVVATWKDVYDRSFSLSDDKSNEDEEQKDKLEHDHLKWEARKASVFASLFPKDISPQLLEKLKSTSHVEINTVDNQEQKENAYRLSKEYKGCIVGSRSNFDLARQLMSGCAVIKLDHQGYHGWFEEGLIPKEHYLPVDDEGTTLDEYIKLITDERAEIVTEIAKRGQLFAKNMLKPEAISCYIYSVLLEYYQLLTW